VRPSPATQAAVDRAPAGADSPASVQPRRASARWLERAALLVALAIGGACTSDATVESPTAASTTGGEPAETAGSTTTIDPVEPETTPNQQTGQDEEETVPSNVRTGAQSRTTIATDAGSIDASYADGRLEVEIESKPGWSADVQRRSPTRVEVVWTSDSGSVHAEVEAGDGGITSTTRSVTTG
jgi:hypothetical protein